MFGGQTIIDRDNNTSSSIRDATAQRALRIEVAYLPASCMEKDQDRERATSLWGIYPGGNLTRRARNHAVFVLKAIAGDNVSHQHLFGNLHGSSTCVHLDHAALLQLL